jgi:multidrug efflux pump
LQKQVGEARAVVDILRQEPAIETVSGFTGGTQTNSGFVFLVLKPLSERIAPVYDVMRRLRPKLLRPKLKQMARRSSSPSRPFASGAYDK